MHHPVAAAPERRDEVEGVAAGGRRERARCEVRELEVEEDEASRRHERAVEPRLDAGGEEDLREGEG